MLSGSMSHPGIAFLARSIRQDPALPEADGAIGAARGRPRPRSVPARIRRYVGQLRVRFAARTQHAAPQRLVVARRTRDGRFAGHTIQAPSRNSAFEPVSRPSPSSRRRISSRPRRLSARAGAAARRDRPRAGCPVGPAATPAPSRRVRAASGVRRAPTGPPNQTGSLRPSTGRIRPPEVRDRQLAPPVDDQSVASRGPWSTSSTTACMKLGSRRRGLATRNVPLVGSSGGDGSGGLMAKRYGTRGRSPACRTAGAGSSRDGPE